MQRATTIKRVMDGRRSAFRLILDDRKKRKCKYAKRPALRFLRAYSQNSIQIDFKYLSPVKSGGIDPATALNGRLMAVLRIRRNSLKVIPRKFVEQNSRPFLLKQLQARLANSP
jgi:hypothetical protein